VPISANFRPKPKKFQILNRLPGSDWLCITKICAHKLGVPYVWSDWKFNSQLWFLVWHNLSICVIKGLNYTVLLTKTGLLIIPDLWLTFWYCFYKVHLGLNQQRQANHTNNSVDHL
jgi:hypothetical protein